MQNFARMLAMAASVSVLAACSSGGGSGGGVSGGASGSNAPATGGSTPANTNVDPGTGLPYITVPALPSPSMGPNAALIDSSAGQTVGGSPSGWGPGQPAPAIGTIFPLLESAMDQNVVGGNVTMTPLTAINNGGATLTYLGLANSSTPGFYTHNFELKIPDLNIDATLALPGPSVVSGNSSAQININFLSYTMAGNWTVRTPYNSGNGDVYSGAFLTGYQTPAAALPTTGQATYSTSAPVGGVSPTASGLLYDNFPGAGAARGTVTGDASVTVNFATGAVNGAITNMVAQPSLGGGVGQNWNSVSLTGSMSGATMSGTTAVSAQPATAGTVTFDTSSTGVFNGALYGPSGQELGAVWTLHDPTGNGKSVVGVIAAPKIP